MSAARAVEGLVEWAVACSPYPGESLSGDAHAVVPGASGVLIAVVDGLGHGPEAHEAAQAAIRAVSGSADAELSDLFERCHRQLTDTRGVAMTVAVIRTDGGLEWFGVGNVEAVLCPSTPESPREHVPLRGGIVGYGTLPGVQPAATRLRRDDVLVFATDGIASRFLDDVPGIVADVIAARRPPDAIATRVHAGHANGHDDALVLVARFVGDSP